MGIVTFFSLYSQLKVEEGHNKPSSLHILFVIGGAILSVGEMNSMMHNFSQVAFLWGAGGAGALLIFMVG